MEGVTKVFFDPLATTKAKIRELLEGLPVGSAHPFSPERLLLCQTATGISEIDISSYPERHFFNAVDLGELGQTLQTRMTKFESQLRKSHFSMTSTEFKSHNLSYHFSQAVPILFPNLLTCYIGAFNDEYTVQQCPTSTFKVPLQAAKISILAVSERYPTYYDLCVADEECKTTCYSSTNTFAGMSHSSDINQGSDLLHHIKIDERLQSGKEFVVFVSGFQRTKLTRFQDRNPVVMIANHAEKVSIMADQSLLNTQLI